MVRSRRMRCAAAGTAAIAALTGCVANDEPEPSVSSTEPASSSPSNESLLEEARSTYDGFLATASEMWDQPDVDYTAFLDWASAEVATDEAAAHEALRAEGVVRIEPVMISAFELADGPTADEVDTYICLDFSTARRLNAAGEDVTPTDAQAFVALQVRFEPGNERLVITQQEALPDGVPSPCG